MSESENVFTLDYPINFGGETISTVPLARLKAKDMKEAAKKGGGYAYSHFIISKSTGLTLLEIDELDAADYDALVEAITPFLSRTPK
jgi:hypothetical protein